MSVDEAFRRLMAGNIAAAPGSVPATATAAGGVGQSAIAASEVVNEVPFAPSPAPRPMVPPLDLTKVRRARRLAYFPIDNRSQIAEEYRILRTRLSSLELSRPSILLTSCHHNEGKTNTALHLALTSARRKGSKVLLVDLDLRRPRLSKMLGLPKMKYDIVSVLRKQCPVEAAMIYSEEDNLYVLSAKREYSGGTDFLEPQYVQPLFDSLHATFDFIVVDTCPCLSTSDPAILGPYVGGAIMIIRSLQTQRESIEHAISNLQDLDVPVIGVVLTFMRYFLPRYLYRYQYYHGHYYYHGYSDAEAPPPMGENASAQDSSDSFGLESADEMLESADNEADAEKT